MENGSLSPVFLWIAIFFPPTDPFFKNELRTCPYKAAEVIRRPQLEVMMAWNPKVVKQNNRL